VYEKAFGVFAQTCCERYLCYHDDKSLSFVTTYLISMIDKDMHMQF